VIGDRVVRATRRFFGVRAGEERLARLFFWYFFLLAAPLAIIKPLRTTEFLIREGAGALPAAYLVAAVATGLVVLLHSKIGFRSSLRTTIIASLLFFAATGLVLRFVLGKGSAPRSSAWSYLYWVWASVMTVALLTHFWMLINEVYNAREAKRLMGYICTGGILGGVLGGLLVFFLTRAGLDGWLLPAASIMLVASVLVVSAVLEAHEKHAARPGPHGAGPDAPAESKSGFWDSFRAVRENRFLALIAAIVTLGGIVATCIEFQYLCAAVSHYQSNRAGLQAFFGFFEPGLTVFTLLLNVLTARYLTKRLRVTGAMLFTPLVLLAGSLAVLALPFGLLAGMLIRTGEESASFAVGQPVREVMYIPVASRLRHKAKPFIDMFVSQFAKIAAALLLFAFALALKTPIVGFTPGFNEGLAQKLSWVILALLIPWVLFSLKVGKEYLNTLKGNIHPLWERAEKKVGDTIDREQAMLVFDTIDSRNYSAVLYALHIFDLMARDKLTPEIRALIAEKSGEVRASAMSERLEAEGAARFHDGLDELRPQGLLDEIPLIMSSDEYQEVMAAYFDRVMEEGPRAEVKKMELAKLIGLLPPGTPLAARLGRLIMDGSPRVACLALKSAARLRRRDHLPAIIRKLDSYVTLEDAIETLRPYGDAAVPALEKSLKDRAASPILRRAAAEALARIGTRAAAKALAHELEHGRGDIDEAVIDALDRVHSGPGEVHLSAAAAKRKTLSLVRKYCQTYLDLERLGRAGESATPGPRPEASLEAYLADIFKLLGLHYPHKDVRTAYQNIKAGSRHSVAHAIEWLENALKKDLKDAVLPIVEDLDPAEKRKHFERLLKTLPGN
jgi:ATP:ADP antiporter, AAA family